MRRLLWFVFACAVLAACAPSDDERPVRALARSLPTIRFDVSADPSTLDPLLGYVDSGGVDGELARLAFEPFVDVDPHGKLEPALIREIPTLRNGGISADGRTITYHLRRARWSDGAPVTAADVRFTLRAILDPENPVATREGYDRIVAMRAPDPRTVVLRLNAPWAPAVATFFAYGSSPQFVLPEHVLAKQLPLATAPYGARPTVTDGPYRFVQWRRGDGLTYDANPRYWRGRPAIGRIDVHVVPDPNTNLVLMRTRAIDFNLIAPSQIASLRGAAGIRLERAPSAIVAGLAFAVAHPPLDDVRLRRIVAEYIDRRAISRSVALGRYPVADSDRPRFSPAYDATVREPSYDPDAADRELLADGWTLGYGGVHIKDGRMLSLTYDLFPESTTGVRTGIFIQQALAERHIMVTLKQIESRQLFLPGTGTLARGEFDLAYVPWQMSADPDDAFVLGCRDADANWMHYCSLAVDRLERLAATTTRPADRIRLYHRIDAIVARDLPILWLFDADYTYAVGPRIGNFMPNAYSPTWNAWQWRLVPPRDGGRSRERHVAA